MVGGGIWPVVHRELRAGARRPFNHWLRAAGALEFAKLLLEKAQVAVSPGIGFGPLGEIANFLFIERQMREIFATRQEILPKLLSPPG